MQNIVFTIVANSDNAKDALKSLQSEIKVVQKNLTDTEKTGKQGMDGIAKGTKQAGQEVGKFQNSLKSLIAPMAAAFSVAALVSFAKEINKVTAEMQDYHILLKSIHGSEMDAVKAQESLSQMANKHGLEIKNLTRMYTGFMGPAKSLGIEVGKADRIFKNLTLGIKASGGSMQDVEATMSGLIKQLAKGELTAMAFEGRFAKSMPNAMEWFSTSLGVTQNELRKMLDAGQVTIDMLENFAEVAADSGINELADQSASLSAELVRLENSWTDLYISASSSGASVSGVQALIFVVNTLEKAIIGARASLGILLAPFDGGESLSNLLDSVEKKAIVEFEQKYREFQDRQIKSFITTAKQQKKTSKEVHDSLIADAERADKKRLKLLSKGGKLNEAELVQLKELRIQSEAYTAAANNVLTTYDVLIPAKKKSAKETAKEAAELERLRKEMERVQQLELDRMIDSLTRGTAEDGRMAETQYEIDQEILARQKEAKMLSEIHANKLSDLEHQRNMDEINEDDYFQKKLELAEQFAQDTKKVEEEMHAFKKKLTQEELESIYEIASTSMQVSDGMANFGIAMQNRQLANLQTNLEKGIISEEQFEIQSRKIKRKQAIMDRAAALFQIGINTAVSASKNPPPSPLFFLALANGALQSATVIAQPIPYNKGTKRVPMMRGAVRGQDSVHAILTPDERVVPADINNQQGYSALMDLAQDKKISNEEAGFIAKLATSGMGRSSQSSIDYDELGRSIAKHIPHTDVRIDDNGIAIITERRTGEINRLKSRL